MLSVHVSLMDKGLTWYMYCNEVITISFSLDLLELLGRFVKNNVSDGNLECKGAEPIHHL
jgi:hypothetical protein